MGAQSREKLLTEMDRAELMEAVRLDVLCAIDHVDLCPHAIAQILITCGVEVVSRMDDQHVEHRRDCD